MKERKADLFVTALVFLLGLLAFGLGRLSKIEDMREPVTIEEVPMSAGTEPAPGLGVDANVFVASKNGKKYFFAWCQGAQSINPANKITFSTREAAEAAGYTKASNCKGL